MAVALHQRGLFSWSEWAEALAQRIRSEPATAQEDPHAAYYRQWLSALEDLLARKGASSPADLSRYRKAWRVAAERTPHGQPIELLPTDLT